MSYQSLARQYRPATFQDLVGQEAASLALLNSLKLKRVPSGIIFSGTRGVGKTTLARLYAKALNCEASKDSEPCNKCESCKAITLGCHEDVLEIDGASNNGVDEVRVLTETVSYASQRSPYKVYIIDEVHMLSVSAFNALLKTLEEPPANVVFVFATTELHKLPKTVVGRCQTFHLQRIAQVDIRQRIKDVLDSEKITYDEKSIFLVAKQGRGSLRDALTFLEQVIAVCGGELTSDSLTKLMGEVSTEVYINLIQALLDKDSERCIQIISEVDQRGIDFSDAVEEMVSLVRHSFIIKGLGKGAIKRETIGLGDVEYELLVELGKKAKPLDLNRIFRTFVQCLKELGGSYLDHYIFENYCLEWCLDPGFPSLDEVSEQVEKEKVPVNSRVLVNQEQSTTLPPSHEKEQLVSSSPSVPPVSPRLSVSSEGKAEPDRKKGFLTRALKKHQEETSLESKPVVEVKQERVPTPLPSQEKPSSQEVFPPSWQELVSLWKKKKPLQARKLEEVHPLEYSSSRIVLAVDEDGIIGRVLLQKETQTRIAKQFQDLFSFKGQLEVLPKKKSHHEMTSIAPAIASTSEEAHDEGSSSATRSLPDSILQEKEKHRLQNRAMREQKAVNHAIVKGIISEFGGEIVATQIED